MGSNSILKTRDHCLIMIFIFLCIGIWIWHVKTSNPTFQENIYFDAAPSAKKIDRCRALLAKVDQWDTVVERKIPKLDNKKSLRFIVPEEETQNYASIWGEENLIVDKKALHVFFPKGSYKPSAQPRGGAGFIYAEDKLEWKKHAMLSYTLWFADNFEFVKWWKLPGFCSGDCPRGWAATDNGFSTRFMWRANGDLEIYGYLPNKSTSMGQSIGRGMFRFKPWKYYDIAQEIVLNTLGESDGILRVYVDDILVYEKTDMMYQKKIPLWVDKVIFSTFFGGGDPSWATPVDTSITFDDFKVQWN